MRKLLVLALATLAGCATTSSSHMTGLQSPYPYTFLEYAMPMTGPASVAPPAAPMNGRYGPIFTP